jgi:hypothetical protein
MCNRGVPQRVDGLGKFFSISQPSHKTRGNSLDLCLPLPRGRNQFKIVPARGQFNILRQICNFIPPHEVFKITRETGAEDKSRTFSLWGHMVSLLYAQLT